MTGDRGATTLYRPDIDGLRAIAILLVLFFHGGFRQLSGGFVGVDIFFVISGFLITGIILRETNTGDFSFADFYSRRIRRICPALFLVLTLSIIAALFLLVPQDLQLLGRSLGGAVFFYANWHFYNHVGYFDGPAAEKPLLHTWSLAVEEQFYLIWPLLFIALYHFVGRKALPHVILALLCLSLVASQYILQKDAAAAFYLLPYRAWELLLGAYIAFLYTQVPSKIDRNLFRRSWSCSDRLCGSVFQCSDAVPWHSLSYSVRRSGASNFCGPAGQPSEQFRSRRKAAPFHRQDIVFALLDTLASFFVDSHDARPGHHARRRPYHYSRQRCSSDADLAFRRVSGAQSSDQFSGSCRGHRFGDAGHRPLREPV